MRMLPFEKYSGNGNDFIIVEETTLSSDQVIKLCDRHFGVGADGILMRVPSKVADAKMRVFNADGKEAEMCGNGVRCFAAYLDVKLGGNRSTFQVETMNAIYPILKQNGSYALEMTEVKEKNAIDLASFKDYSKSFYINTGVPHLVFLTEDASKVDIRKEGPHYRYHSLFEKGTNVNFVQLLDAKAQKAFVRTYERGVEDETFSCGTGLTATALALNHWFGWSGDVHLTNKGGKQLVALGSKIFYSGEIFRCFKGEAQL